MRPMQLLLAAAALVGVASAGQGYLFPQSACRVHCQNGGACAYDTEDPSIHSCICLVGVYEGERCERLVPGAEDPAAATTTTTTTTTPAPTTPSVYELERRRHEEHRLRIMEERRKHEEERKRIEGERQRMMEERARQEEARRVEMENRGREEEARRKAMEETHRRRVEEERRQAEERRVHEERRRIEEEEKRRAEDEKKRVMESQAKHIIPDEPHEPTHKLDYEEYEDTLDDQRMEEVPEEKITADEDEDIDRVESAEMEKPEDVDDEEDDEEEAVPVTTPEPTKAVTYEVEDDYVTSTTPALEQEAKKDVDDSRMSGEDDDYWDHTPENPDVDAEGNKALPPLPGSTEDVVRGTQIDQTGRAVGVAPLDDTTDEEVEQDGDDGWMMVKRKQTAASSTHHTFLTTVLAALVARWVL